MGGNRQHGLSGSGFIWPTLATGSLLSLSEPAVESIRLLSLKI
jgi:hypothetical protein